LIILDTNVISEALKPSPDARVAAWLLKQAPASLFATTVTQAEMFYGVEMLPAGQRRDTLLAAIIATFDAEFAGRILPFDSDAARAFAAIAAACRRAGRPMGPLDAQIAAIAHSREAPIATRDVSDFDMCGVPVIDPWQA
jgi:predicted nucleic acid-binding protein